MFRKRWGVMAVVTAVILLSGGNTAYAAEQFSGSYFGTGFDAYEAQTMEKSDGWSNGDMFDCTWSGANVGFSGGIMNLSITGNRQSGYRGAEYRTRKTYGFGMYDVSMKPISNVGVVSSFFTYTGPSDGTVWDEIDIEFLGKDTTTVQFNYYTKGVGHHEYVYHLGFDASKAFQQYGFYWDKSGITWYVDKKAVYKATGNIPQTPGKIMMNAWNGKGVDDWLGHYNGAAPLTAKYDWISYTAPKTQEQSSSQSGSGQSKSGTTDFNASQLYVIRNVNSGKALDVYYGSADNGANILQYAYNGYQNQKWYLQKQSDGYYILKSAGSGKVAEVADASSADGANVQQWNYHDAANQEWKIEQVGSNYRIINRLSGKALDVSGRSVKDNANVLQWRYSGAANQLWSIGKA